MTLKRSPMRKKVIRKDWSDAQIKRGPCRVCGRSDTQLAHTISQRAQDEKRVGPRGGKYLWVNPHSVVPLCRYWTTRANGIVHSEPGCHWRYDLFELSILGLLTFPELMNAARSCKRKGIDCSRRLTGGSS